MNKSEVLQNGYTEANTLRNDKWRISFPEIVEGSGPLS